MSRGENDRQGPYPSLVPKIQFEASRPKKQNLITLPPEISTSFGKFPLSFIREKMVPFLGTTHIRQFDLSHTLHLLHPPLNPPPGTTSCHSKNLENDQQYNQIEPNHTFGTDFGKM